MSAAVNAGAPMRHRSRNPQQPKRSRYTDEATSVTWYWLSSSRHISLNDPRPPVAPCSDAAPDGRRVYRLTAVEYFSRINWGNCGRQGTSGSGDEPTEV